MAIWPYDREMRILKYGLIVVSLLVLSPRAAWASNQDNQIVVSIQPIALILSEILPSDFSISVLIKDNQDPHTYEPRPSDLRLIEEASLYLTVDEDLESSLPKLDRSTPLLKMIPKNKRVKKGLWGSDPHFWLSPKSVQALMKPLVDHLCKSIDGIDCAEVNRARQKFEQSLSILSERIDREFESTAFHLVASHDSLSYLCRDLNWTCQALESGGHHHHHHGTSAGRIASTIDSLDGKENVLLVSETSIPPTAIRTIAEKTAQPILTIDILGTSPSHSGYIQFFTDFIDQLAKATHQESAKL